MTKLTTTTFKKNLVKDVFAAFLILGASFLPYLHDIGDLQQYDGFSGFKTMRIGVYFVCMFIVALSGWVVAFVNSAGKRYRFIMLAPIFMLAYQLGIYLFDARNTTTNEFSTKIILNIGFAIVITAAYFIGTAKRNK